MNQATISGKFDEAVWDTTPIIRMFCAELDGRCACMRNVREHVYPHRVGEELHRKKLKDIMGQLGRDGEEIKDKQEAIAILNAMRGSMIFHFREHPNIDTHSISSKYDLQEETGEFWVIAYAISKASNNILVVMDDGQALAEICKQHEETSLQQFTLWTSLHIIYRLMEAEHVLTSERGKRLFLRLDDRFFRRLDSELQNSGLRNSNLQGDLRLMRREIHRKDFRIRVAKRRPLYRHDASTKDWVYPLSL